MRFGNFCVFKVLSKIIPKSFHNEEFLLSRKAFNFLSGYGKRITSWTAWANFFFRPNVRALVA